MPDGRQKAFINPFAKLEDKDGAIRWSEGGKQSSLFDFLGGRVGRGFQPKAVFIWRRKKVSIPNTIRHRRWLFPIVAWQKLFFPQRAIAGCISAVRGRKSLYDLCFPLQMSYSGTSWYCRTVFCTDKTNINTTVDWHKLTLAVIYSNLWLLQGFN